MLISILESDIETIPFPPLGREEFAVALKYGRGSALHHVLAHGLGGVDDLVLEECLNDFTFDGQCQSNRAVWLYQMFKDAPEYTAFATAILTALQGGDDYQYAIEQLCDLASLMARDGNAKAAQTLHNFYWQQDFVKWGCSVYGSKALIAIEGYVAVQELARYFGSMILKDEHADIVALYLQFYEGAEYEVMFAQLAASADPAIAAYVKREQDEYQSRLARANETEEGKALWRAYLTHEMLQRTPLQSIFSAAQQGREGMYFFSYFGHFAHEAHLKSVLQRFNEEKNVEVSLRLLWVFQSGVPPFLPFKLWAYAQHADARLRVAALAALSHITQPEVAQFARQRLQLGALSVRDAKLIELFKHHYQPGDEDLIHDALLKLDFKDEEEIHELGFALRKLCEHQMNPAFGKLLLWLYQRNPCMNCRKAVHNVLQQLDILPAEFDIEFRYDAYHNMQVMDH